jgi:hypothetical protein
MVHAGMGQLVSNLIRAHGGNHIPAAIFRSATDVFNQGTDKKEVVFFPFSHE